MPNNEEWILCPVCQNKTRVKMRDDTKLENYTQISTVKTHSKIKRV